MRSLLIFITLIIASSLPILAIPQQSDPSTKCALESCTSSTGFDKNQCPSPSIFLSTCPCKSNYASSDPTKCDTCAEGYTEFPVCKKCACNPTGNLAGPSSCSSTSSCECKPGYTGKDCFSCDSNYWQFKPSNCKACDCDVNGTQGRGCDVMTGMCMCKPGFSGDRCDQCAQGFSDYPDCNGNIFAQNVPGMVAVAGLLGFGVILFGVLRWKVPHADNVFAFILSLWLGKIISDIAFVATKAKTPSNTAAFAFIFIPMVVNLIISLVIMAKEAGMSKRFQIWVNRNTYLGMILSVLSVGGVEIMLIGQSRLFGWDALTAPFSDDRISHIQFISTVGIVVMNIPQLAYFVSIFVQSGRDKRDVAAFASLVITGMLVLYGIISRLYMIVSSRKHKQEMAQAIAKSGLEARRSRLFALEDEYQHEKTGREHIPVAAGGTASSLSHTSSIATHIQLPASVIPSSGDALMSDHEIQALYNNVSNKRLSRNIPPSTPEPTFTLAAPPRSKGRPISLVIVADDEGIVRPTSVFGDVPPSPRPNMPPPRPPGMESTSPSRATSIEINVRDTDEQP